MSTQGCPALGCRACHASPRCYRPGGPGCTRSDLERRRQRLATLPEGKKRKKRRKNSRMRAAAAAKWSRWHKNTRARNTSGAEPHQKDSTAPGSPGTSTRKPPAWISPMVLRSSGSSAILSVAANGDLAISSSSRTRLSAVCRTSGSIIKRRRFHPRREREDRRRYLESGLGLLQQTLCGSAPSPLSSLMGRSMETARLAARTRRRSLADRAPTPEPGLKPHWPAAGPGRDVPRRAGHRAPARSRLRPRRVPPCRGVLRRRLPLPFPCSCCCSVSSVAGVRAGSGVAGIVRCPPEATLAVGLDRLRAMQRLPRRRLGLPRRHAPASSATSSPSRRALSRASFAASRAWSSASRAALPDSRVQSNLPRAATAA